VTFTCQNVSGGQGTPGPRNVAQICVQTTPAAQLTIAATQCDGKLDDNLKQTSGTADSAGHHGTTPASHRARSSSDVSR